MAGSPLGTPGVTRKSRRAAEVAPLMSEINVTPFVDVMLVLLIIFMVAAPMMTVSVPVDIPTGAKAAPTPSDPLTVTVQLDGAIYVNDTAVTEQTLIAKVDELATEGLEQRIFIRGDKGVDYGRMVGIVGALSLRGYRKIGLVSTVAPE
jgi:biopolymer transport protein TolR